jgi:AraC-like DNA-binding protein
MSTPNVKRLFFLESCQHISDRQGLYADHPDDNRTLAAWGKMVGATGRTLARRFKVETGMTFGQWRQQMRILEALKRLARNEPVTTVAIELGYESPSAFISMFKKSLGTTPGRYFLEG